MRRCPQGRFVPPPSVPRMARALPVGLTTGRRLAPAAASGAAARGCVYEYITLFWLMFFMVLAFPPGLPMPGRCGVVGAARRRRGPANLGALLFWVQSC